MDALYRLLVEQYKMDPTKAQKYADLIHHDHSNPDNLQTEAYGQAAGSKQDFNKQSKAGSEPGTNYKSNNPMSDANPNKEADNALGNMGRLKQRAEVFTSIHKRVQAGEQVDPAQMEYYGKVMALHQQKVRDNANKQVATADANQIVQQAGQMQQQVRGIGDRAREMQGGGADPMRMNSGEPVGCSSAPIHSQLLIRGRCSRPDGGNIQPHDDSCGANDCSSG
jgi:hypothetical protein